MKKEDIEIKIVAKPILEFIDEMIEDYDSVYKIRDFIREELRKKVDRELEPNERDK